jgi:hypothetical protein
MLGWLILLVFFYFLGGVVLAAMYADKVWARRDTVDTGIAIRFLAFGPGLWVREKVFRRVVP